MYCKHCGQEIDEDSKFCKYCGKSLGLASDISIKGVNWFVVVSFAIWEIINIILLVSPTAKNASNTFYPFTEQVLFNGAVNPFDMSLSYTVGNFNSDYYDGSEFLIYGALVPVIIYVIYKSVVFYRNKKK